MSSQNSNKLAGAAIRGTTWTYIAFYSSKLVVFITTVILAHYLTKGDFGVVGYAVTTIGFLDVVKDLGIGASLIYHREKEVFPTAFWLSLLTNFAFFLLMWIAAPLVGSFFNDPRAMWVTRILAINFPLNALGSTHEALLIKELEFRKRFVPEFAKAIVKGVVAISLAFLGFGPWSLIISQLSGTFVAVIVLWKIVAWRPSFTFSSQLARSLLSFGLPLVGMNVVSAVALNIDYVFIGRYLGSDSLGLYTLAFRVPELTILYFCGIVAQVIFPIFSKIREDADALKRGFLETARYVALVTVPIGLGMALLAEPFVLALFGEKWLEAAPVLRGISFYALFISLGFNAGDVYKAQGRPGMLTLMSILHILLLVPGLFWAVIVQGDIVLVGWVQAFVALIISVIYLLVALKMLKMPIGELLNALKAPFIPGLGMTAAVLAVIHYITGVPAWLQLTIGIAVGGFTYLALLYLTQKMLVVQSIQIVRTVMANRSS